MYPTKYQETMLWSHASSGHAMTVKRLIKQMNGFTQHKREALKPVQEELETPTLEKSSAAYSARVATLIW